MTGCDPAEVRRLGLDGLTDAVRAELPHGGTRRIYRPILVALHAAADRRGVPAQRPAPWSAPRSPWPTWATPRPSATAWRP